MIAVAVQCRRHPFAFAVTIGMWIGHKSGEGTALLGPGAIAVRHHQWRFLAMNRWRRSWYHPVFLLVEQNRKHRQARIDARSSSVRRRRQQSDPFDAFRQGKTSIRCPNSWSDSAFHQSWFAAAVAAIAFDRPLSMDPQLVGIAVAVADCDYAEQQANNKNWKRR